MTTVQTNPPALSSGEDLIATVLKRRFMPVFLLVTIVPLIILGLFLAVNLLAHTEYGLRMLSVLPVHVLPFGSEGSAAYLVLSGVPFILIVVFLSLSDLATSLPFIAFAQGARHVPILGPQVVRLESRGAAFYNKHEWFRRLGAVGLAGFVALPLAGTGSTIGVLMGRAAGMSNVVIATCVVTGALVRWTMFVGAVAGVSLLF